ncbi:MAG TPA: hypothetical protein VL025_12445, partial [Thermoanaerobaculia bacterium]|nr:hypothetical protein [Thermoanaerobaculia bacterium]
MYRFFRRPLFLAFAALAVQPLPVTDQVRVILRTELPASGAAPRLEIEGQGFRASPFLSCFYERREFLPAWSVDGNLRPEAEELLAALAAAGNDGLRAGDYRPEELARLAAEARSRPEAGSLAELDRRLSDAFLTFAAHLR